LLHTQLESQLGISVRIFLRALDRKNKMKKLEKAQDEDRKVFIEARKV